jgi:LmbE family N-acetylglucosaminyl deacetylase
MKSFKRVLVLSPNLYDGIIAAGGSIARFIEEGNHVSYVVFSMPESSQYKGLYRKSQENKFMQGVKTIGISEENIIKLDYQCNSFQKNRQQILEDIIGIGKRIMPDLVICPASFIIHQDHQVIYYETIRAYKKLSTIWGMIFPWTNINIGKSIYVKLTIKQFEKKNFSLNHQKVACLNQWLDKEYKGPNSLLIGWNRRVKYLEVFECIRFLIRL